MLGFKLAYFEDKFYCYSHFFK